MLRLNVNLAIQVKLAHLNLREDDVKGKNTKTHDCPITLRLKNVQFFNSLRQCQYHWQSLSRRSAINNRRMKLLLTMFLLGHI